MNVNALAATTASALVAAAVAAGLFLGGSPAEQRRLRFDERRVDDLHTLSQVIRAHGERVERLPETLEGLVNGQDLSRLPGDPENGELYVYEVIGPSAYRLCATFSEATPNPGPTGFWTHDAGHQCFEFDLSYERERVRNMTPLGKGPT